MEYLKINNQEWNVRILSITETSNILDTENAGRVIEKGSMVLDRIGTFYGHNVTFGRNKNSKTGRDDFDSLYGLLTYPWNQGLDVVMVHNQSTIAYKAYCTVGERKIAHIDENNHIVDWENFTCNFIPMEAQVTP